jgi:hypothetical protein
MQDVPFNVQLRLQGRDCQHDSYVEGLDSTTGVPRGGGFCGKC